MSTLNRLPSKPVFLKLFRRRAILASSKPWRAKLNLLTTGGGGGGAGENPPLNFSSQLPFKNTADREGGVSPRRNPPTGYVTELTIHFVTRGQHGPF